ncbi:MAG TPA: MarR family transcriptional regulator [Kofleriaceae bacterium]|nr:MarR family transcriptional regulator [Kofleriaceae bacterium]
MPRSTLELLFRAARLVNERAVHEARASGAKGLRLAHTQLFPHITSDGIRLTELAARLEISKQAVGPLIDELVAQKVVERIPDPDDKRAKLIRWTQRGRRALLHGMTVLDRLERDLAHQIGARRMTELADTLDALVAAVAR